jgi:hypothetical protein
MYFAVEKKKIIKNKIIFDEIVKVLFQKCVRQFGPSTKMAPTAELSLTLDPMGNSHKNLLLRNHWANCNQTFWNDPWKAPFQNCVR